MPPTPAATFATPLDAFRQFMSEETMLQEGFILAKSTLQEAYAEWALSAPGRPALSPKHIGMLVHAIYPATSDRLWMRYVELPIAGVIRGTRPSVWVGLRLLHPHPLDPFELAHAALVAPPMPSFADQLAEMTPAERRAFLLDED